MAPSPRADARRVSTLVGLLMGLAGMGSSSAAIALPVLALDLDISTGVSAWAISLYALMLAVATAVYGRVADLVGIRLPLLVGVGLMTAGAVVGAFGPSFGVLIADLPGRRPGRRTHARGGRHHRAVRRSGAGSRARQGRRRHGCDQLGVATLFFLVDAGWARQSSVG